MGWEDYVHSLEGGKGKCTYAGIFGTNPDVSVWSESVNKNGFPVTVPDVSKIVRAIKGQDSSIYGSGIVCANINFTCLRMEPDLIVLQGKGDNKDLSLVVALTTQAAIVGFNNQADVKTASVRDGVETIKDHLKNCGY